ncbi:hypothetical protein WJX82_002295 [Trebouxia sp. C0006]
MTAQSVHVPSKDRDEPRAASASSERVWTLKELEILHEICKPTVVIVSSVYDSPHSPGGLRSRHRVVFENQDCMKRFGLPRSQEDHDLHMSTFPEDFQKTRRAWLSRVATSKKTTEVRIDLRVLMSPLFYGISELSPVCMAKLESKPILVETSPGHTEAAILHMADMEECRHRDHRLAAMLDRSPIHAVLFSRSGKVLCANKAAGTKIESVHAAAGIPFNPQDNSLKQLFLYGMYPGGQEEALMHYEDAMTAVFSLQLNSHRHVQPYRSKKDGRIKWATFEMWPMSDPIGGSPAVLIKKWNITNEKQLEMQLEASQEALQRYNQELEEDSAAMEQERLQLQQQAESLAQRLEAVLSDNFVARTAFDADTPIDKTLAFLQDVIKGSTPSTQRALDLYHVLSESDTNLRQPIELENQLLKHMTMDSEVGQSMLQLLQGHRVSDPEDGDAGNNWQFDIFEFAAATPGNTLSLLTFHFLKQSGGIDAGRLDAAKFIRFSHRIEAGYNPANPYHNSIHVASVVQMTHMLLRHGGILKSGAMTQQQYWGSLWSALVHDFEHGGLNNDFLIKTHHPLAITYNDQSPLENHHVSAASRLLSDPELAYLPMDATKAEHRAATRFLSVNQVLGTDMKKHFDIVSRFQAVFKPLPAKEDSGPSDSQTTAAPALDWESVKPEDKTLVHQMVLKCADIGHLAAAARTHKRWAYQLEEEFFRQGDKERTCGLPVSPLMDRSTQGGMTRSQLGFFSIVGIPLFKAMAELFEDAQPMLDGGTLEANEPASHPCIIRLTSQTRRRSKRPAQHTALLLDSPSRIPAQALRLR